MSKPSYKQVKQKAHKKAPTKSHRIEPTKKKKKKYPQGINPTPYLLETRQEEQEGRVLSRQNSKTQTHT
jgi:hypothetical protein